MTVRIRIFIAVFFIFASTLSLSACSSKPPRTTTPVPPPAAEFSEDSFISNVRQLSFLGKRSGEGYFSPSGRSMIFQSERQEDNPFYQMYLMDFPSGEVSRVSPGYGKTTCGWIHPRKNLVLFSSTHQDPQSQELQQKELAFRASGKSRRYSWDYDENYDIYSKELPAGLLRKLSNERGYDAEASYSPDGQRILFASNREGYQKDLSEEEKAIFQKDKSYFIDLYSMAADGSDVQRLTDHPGYDGGPFYSADAQFITWRRFNKAGTSAEIYLMHADGSNQRQLTNLKAMSWAPYFHPSGDYLIFATNLHGFKNFELYLVRADGKNSPVRVTTFDGFDGLPVFSPDGRELSWTSKRGFGEGSQLFIADWNDSFARRALRLPEKTPPPRERSIAAGALKLKSLVSALAAPSMQGRRTGTIGEKKATQFAADELAKAGLDPAGDENTYFQDFTFTSGVKLGSNNKLQLQRNGAEFQTLKAGKDWTPLSFSKTGEIEEAGIVFAGYGIKAPATSSTAEYDSYVHTNVKDKWVLVLRGIPSNVSKDLHSHLARHSSPRYKAMLARDLGAKGLLFARGPVSKLRSELLPLRFDRSSASSSLAVLSLSDELTNSLFRKSLSDLQAKLDRGEALLGYELPGVKLRAQIDIEEQTNTGRNVLAILRAAEEFQETAKTIIIGAHIDHLGVGANGSSLAKGEEADSVHFGADDNASGVAAAIEIARELALRKNNGSLRPRHNLVIGLWSGEEMGLLGSAHFVNSFEKPSDSIASYINMDMVGRLREALIVQGISSSPAWPGIIETTAMQFELPLRLQKDSYLPTDATSFYLAGVPILSAFTGAHEQYHTPRDTPETLNYEGLASIRDFLSKITVQLLTKESSIPYAKSEKPQELGRRANLRAYLGTIPDYSGSDTLGVRLSGLSSGSPAEKAGLQSQDVIVELDGKKIENIYDYTYSIEALKIGEEVSLKVKREGEILELRITPGSRE